MNDGNKENEIALSIECFLCLCLNLFANDEVFGCGWFAFAFESLFECEIVFFFLFYFYVELFLRKKMRRVTRMARQMIQKKNKKKKKRIWFVRTTFVQNRNLPIFDVYTELYGTSTHRSSGEMASYQVKNERFNRVYWALTVKRAPAHTNCIISICASNYNIIANLRYFYSAQQTK